MARGAAAWSHFGVMALSLLCPLAGCRFEEGVPATTVVTCAEDAHCPPGLLCQVTLGRCVATLDDEVPVILSAALELAPLRGNPSRQPTALNRRVVARVRFETSEPLGGPPTLETPPVVGCTQVSSTSTAFDFDCVVPSAVTVADEQAVPLATVITDRAGNRARYDLSHLGLTLDLEPPPAPATERPGVVVYRQTPWGSDSTSGAPRYSVSGTEGATDVDAGAREVLVLVRGVEQARGSIARNGSFTSLLLPAAEADEVALVAVDGAGNTSAAAPVKDVEWVATLGGKRAGDAASNPHALEQVRVHGRPTRRLDAQEVSAEGWLEADDGLATAVEGAASWRLISTDWPESEDAMLAWDVDRARLVRFGGTASSGGLAGVVPTNLLIEWTGSGWLKAAPTPGAGGTPVARTEGALTWDAARHRLLLFGGLSFRPLGDTWALADGQWQRLPDGPPPRSGAGLFFEPAGRRAILAGGSGDDGGLADVWALTAAGWQRLDAGLPEARAGAAWATDPTTGGAVLFGGQLGGGLGDDVLAWRGEAFEPLPISGASRPPPRTQASLALDADRRLLVLAGGRDDAGVRRDAWVLPLDGGAWRQVDDVPAPDGGREARLTLFWDPAAGRVFSSAGAWVSSLEGARWVGELPAPPPSPPAQRTKLTWNPVTRRVTGISSRTGVLVGPSTPHRMEFTGSGWVSTTGFPFSPGLGAAEGTFAEDACWDEGRQAVVLSLGSKLFRVSNAGAAQLASGGLPAGDGFRRAIDGVPPGLGVSLSDHFSLPHQGPALFPGGDGRLRQLWSPGVNASVTSSPGGLATVIDRAAGASQVWVLDGGAWVVETSLPANLVLPTAVGLPDGGAVVAGAILQDAGVTNARGASYALSSAGARPLADTDVGGLVSLSWSATRGAVLAHGGFDRLLAPSSTTFELRGDVWVEVPLADPEGDGNPAPRLGASLAHDPTTGCDVAFGGFNLAPLERLNTSALFTGGAFGSTEPFDDTWVLSWARQRPAVYFRVSLDAARLGAATPTAMTLRVSARGDGRGSEGGAVGGYLVQVLRNAAWRTLATVSSAPGRLQRASVRVADPALLEALVRGPADVSFALVPLGENGGGAATLAVDYVELNLEYHRP